MGMFSEIHASSEVKGLEQVLLKAIKSNNKEVMIFCKENVLPLYESACGEAWAIDPMIFGAPNKDITNEFNAL